MGIENLSSRFSRILDKIHYLTERFYLKSEIKEYIQLNKKRFKIKKQPKSKEIVLVDFLDSYPVNETYAYIVNNLIVKYDCQVKYFKFDYDKYDLMSFFVNKKLKKIYESFNTRQGFSYNLLYIFSSLIYAYKIFKNLNSKQDIIKIKIYSIPVGELIYDTYLRKFNEKTININSIKLYLVIFQSCLILKSIHVYFSKNIIKAVLPGDVAYIFSGLIAKYAIKHNIEVYSIVETDGFLITKLEDINYYRRMPYWEYSQIFNSLNKKQKEKNLYKAKQLLENRLAGKNDSTLSYMVGESAFNNKAKTNQILLNTDKMKVLVPLHDFFDSPHIYRYMLFPDFWEWIITTLDNAKNTNFEWYIKPHPNALPQNKKIILELKNKYKNCDNIIFIEPSVSNLQLMEEGIGAVFTVYGSVGHEFAYKDIVVVNAGDNPHISFSFNINPLNINEYINCIRYVDRLRVNIDKNEILSFFYMHYIYYKPLELLSPVYPPKNYVVENKIDRLSSKKRRIFYHKNIETVKFYIKNYSKKQDIKINNFLDEVL